jgi:hypothetical protein
MAIVRRPNALSGLDVVVWHGHISLDEVTEHVKVMAADTNGDRSAKLLTSLTDVVSIPRSVDLFGVSTLFAEQFQSSLHNVRWAIVARQLFPQAAGFEESVRDHAPHTVVFNELRAACSWLDVDHVAVESIIDELRTRSITTTTEPA